MRNPANRMIDGLSPHRCPGCRLLLVDCICALLPSLPIRTRVVLVLHNAEEHKTSNTGRLAIRCLPNSEVVLRGIPGAPTARVHPDPEMEPLLLFPEADAKEIGFWKDHAKPVELFVPDGTWGQAQRARNRVGGLGALPCARVSREGPSTYRLRTTADPRRLSTLEAIAEALGVLEGPHIRDELLRIFDVMVERSLRHRVR